MADEFYLGDDFDQLKVTLEVDGLPYSFVGSTLRWWLAVDRDGSPAFSPKTVVDGGSNSFTNGYYYPILTAAETATLTATDYWLVTEVTAGGKIRTFADERITFSDRGL